MKQNLSAEVTDYLARYPQTKHIDVYLNGIVSIMRGKRLSVESMLNLEHFQLPLSVYSMDQKEDCASLHDEPDRLCVPVPGSLCPSPQAPEHNAQNLLTMNENSDGKSCPLTRVMCKTSLLASTSMRAFPGDCTRD